MVRSPTRTTPAAATRRRARTARRLTEPCVRTHRRRPPRDAAERGPAAPQHRRERRRSLHDQPRGPARGVHPHGVLWRSVPPLAVDALSAPGCMQHDAQLPARTERERAWARGEGAHGRWARAGLDARPRARQAQQRDRHAHLLQRPRGRRVHARTAAAHRAPGHQGKRLGFRCGPGGPVALRHLGAPLTRATQSRRRAGAWPAQVENVLLCASGDDSGQFKLADFGSATTVRLDPATLPLQQIARVAEEIQHATTLTYRAPEQVDLYRRQPVDERVDIWVRCWPGGKGSWMHVRAQAHTVKAGQDRR